MSDSQDCETWVICIFLEPFFYLLLLQKILLNESAYEYTAESFNESPDESPDFLYQQWSTELQLC